MRATLATLAVVAVLGPSTARGEQVLYRATGASDSAKIATAVHCTHFGSGTSTITVRFFGASGSELCSVTRASVPNLTTNTFSTRTTSLFFDDEFCSVAPQMTVGTLEVAVANGSSRRVQCSAHLLDPSSNRAFLEELPLYHRTWLPLARVIFEGGFESGDMTDWSSTTP